MAIVVIRSPRGPEFLGRRKFVYATVTGDTSYPTGGSVFPSAGALGLRKIEDVTLLGGNAAPNLVKYHYDRPNNKLMAAWTGAAVNTDFDEIPNATNRSGDTLDVLVTGV